MRPAQPREISGLPSHGRINATGNLYTLLFMLSRMIPGDVFVFKKCNLSDVSTNVVVLKSTENSGCSFVNSERSHYIQDSFFIPVVVTFHF